MIAEAIQEIKGMAISFAKYDAGGREIIAHTGLTVEDVEKFLPTPYRKAADIKLRSSESFIEYVNDHKCPETHLFGNIDAGTVTAEIDYHARGCAGAPSWRTHKVSLVLPKSPDWNAWVSKCGSGALSQSGLAEFLEEMDHTIIEPEAARVIEIVEKLKLTADRKFESSVNRSTGAMTFMYSDDTQAAKGAMKMPEKLFVSVAPFRFAKPVDMTVFLRYRLSEGKLSFYLKLDRPDMVLDDAFGLVVKDIEDQTKIPVLMQ